MCLATDINYIQLKRKIFQMPADAACDGAALPEAQEQDKEFVMIGFKSLRSKPTVEVFDRRRQYTG